MLSRIRNKVIRNIYNRVARSVRSTAPVSNFSDKIDLIILSMVQHSDVDMLLVAIKSFARFVPVNKFVIVADPTLTDEDKVLLTYHMVRVEFIDADYLAVDGVPRGGCWERILGIAEVSKQGFVIQLDADTITVNNPVEVSQAVKNGVSFTLGTKSGQSVTSISDAEAFAASLKGSGENHIQIECEAILSGLPDSYRHYVRGCAGFAGFAKSSMTKEKLVEVSEYYYKNLRKRWEEWGSDQFASNLMFANSAKTIVLPLDKYDVASREKALSFHHYIGTMRYSSMLYVQNTKLVISDLRNS